LSLSSFDLYDEAVPGENPDSAPAAPALAETPNPQTEAAVSEQPRAEGVVAAEPAAEAAEVAEEAPPVAEAPDTGESAERSTQTLDEEAESPILPPAREQ
jgi:hypothetical protein